MTTIDLSPMKGKVLEFPEPLRSLILSEPDRMDVAEFITKLGTWERLLKINTKKEER